MSDFTSAALGGVLIGVASGIVLLVNGRVAGVSGTVSAALRPANPERGWRTSFLLGLAIGGVLLAWRSPGAVVTAPVASAGPMVAAGLLVGIGARLGGGCTSGHGICGSALGRRASIAATLTFVAAGVIAVYVARHLMGVLS